MSVSAISIDNRGGGWDGWLVGWGGVGGGKNPHLGHPMNSHETHTVTNDTIVGHSQWEQIQVPTAQLVPSMSAIVPAVTLEGRQNALQ